MRATACARVPARAGSGKKSDMRFFLTLRRTAFGAGLALSCLAAPGRAEPSSDATRALGGPVIGCTSLANLRSLLRQSEGNPVAQLAILADPRADLGCAPVDPATVTAITDHVNLNGSAYDCLGLKQTAICHWVVAGSLAPAAPATPPAEPAPAARKPKR